MYFLRNNAHMTNKLNFRGELVTLGDIENIYKKRKHDKEARLETVRVIGLKKSFHRFIKTVFIF